MSLQIDDMGGPHQVEDLSGLEAVLGRRHGAGRVNHFWIGHAGDHFPLLTITVTGDLAVVNYLPGPDDAGFLSQGDLEDLEPRGLTVFHIDTPEQEHPFPNEAVVPFASAVAAAKAFLLDKRLPPSLKWLKL